MNMKLLSAVSTLALAVALPAQADSATSHTQQKASTSAQHTLQGNTPDTPDMFKVAEMEMDQAMDAIDKKVDAIDKKVDKMADKMGMMKDEMMEEEDMYKAALVISEEQGPISYIQVYPDATAKGLMNKDVRSTDGKKVGEIDDIILSQNGKIDAVIVNHDGFLGFAEELAAFNYNQVARIESDNDAIIPLSEAALESAKEFSYDTDKAERNMDIIGMMEGQMRASKLLESDVRNPQGEDVADAENIFFNDGQATYLVVSPKEVFEINEERLALDFNELTLELTDEGSYQFTMSPEQTARLEQVREGTFLSAAEYLEIEPAAGPGDVDIVLNPRGVKLLQDTLNERGYHSGPKDGVIGPVTRSAIERFQRDHDMPVTGTPTRDTLSELGMHFQYK